MNKIKTFQFKLSKGKFLELLNDCNQEIRIDNKNLIAREYKSLALANLNREEELLESLNEILKIDNDNLFANLNLARFFKKKNNIKAKEKYLKTIELSGDNIGVLNEYAIYQASLKELDEAIRVFRKILFYEPNNYSTLFNIGFAYQQNGKNDLAIIFLQKALSFHPNKVMVLNVLALSYYYEKNLNKAKALYLEALELNPNYVETIINLSILEQNFGNFHEAEKFLFKAIKISPNDGEIHRTFSLTHKYKSYDDFHLNKMIKILNNNKKIVSEKSFYFALAKAYDDLNDFKKASNYYLKGNQLRRLEFKNYNFKDEILIFEKFKKIFDNNFANKFKTKTSLGQGIIFIVGMPRSGTTLLESIICSNNEVKGHGELNYFSEAVEVILKNQDIFEFEKIVKNNLTFNELTNIGKYYLNKINKLNFEKKKIQIDKNPLNFRLLPLIAMSLPSSKIIHIKRNAEDNLLSLFKNYFSQFVMPWCYDQEELCIYYKSYDLLIKHYKEILGDKIIDINYDHLVSDSYTTIMDLINELKLEWTDDYLSHFKNKRVITTASVSQAREKIYKTSVNNWQNYKDYFTELFKEYN